MHAFFAAFAIVSLAWKYIGYELHWLLDFELLFTIHILLYKRLALRSEEVVCVAVDDITNLAHLEHHAVLSQSACLVSEDVVYLSQLFVEGGGVDFATLVV